MKRSRLTRRQPLKRSTGLERGTELGRGRVLRTVSVRRAAENRIRVRNAHETYGDNPPCGRPGCTRYADDLHEIKTRARGGSITRMANCVPLCRACHDEVTGQPGWAYDLGILVHSWQPEPTVAPAGVP